MGFTNSSLATYKNISPNKTVNRNHAIDVITIHCMAAQWTAKQCCDYFAKSSVACSSNYTVGKDGSIGLSVEEKDRSWCSSNATNDHRAVTIEVASDTTHPYAVTDKAFNALIDLVTDICKRNNIKELRWKADKNLIGKVDQQNMTVHRFFANKSCPGDYLYERHSYIAEQVNKRLNSSTTSTLEDLKFEVGDIVNFAGGKHYISASAKLGTTVKASKAKVMKKYKAGTHPYLLRAVNDSGSFISGVYGWVDSANVSSVQVKTFKPYQIKTTANQLNIRKGAGTNYGKIGVIKDKGKDVYTIVDEATGKGATKWGLLKAYEKKRNGWISLDYCKKL